MKQKKNLLLVITLLVALFTNSLMVSAAPVSEQRQVVFATAENEFELSVSELETEEFELEFLQGEEYLLHVEDGWQFEEFKLSKDCLENFTVEWEEDDLGVPDKTVLKIKCHKTGAFKIELSLKNLSTGEVKILACKTTVVLPYNTTVLLPYDTVSKAFQQSSSKKVIKKPSSSTVKKKPSSNDKEVNSKPNDSTSLPNDDKPNDDKPNDDKPTTPTPLPEVPELIEIDTSNWKFENVLFVYDGEEHSVRIVGLPDWVIPVYHNNTRTNAGSNKVTVSFLVPEGYQVPKDMEIEMTVEKATYSPVIFSENDIESLGNGDFKISIPNLPDGVEASYTVNGQKVDKDHIFSGTGAYVVKTEYTIPDTENYNPIESSEIVYNIKEEVPANPNPDYEVFLRQIVSDDGTLKVEFLVNCVYTTASGMQTTLKFDDTVLDFKGIELNEEQWDYCSYKPETGFMYLTPNFAYGMTTVGILTFVKKDANDKVISDISLDNIMILDRNFGSHTVDKVDELVTDLPRYDVTIPKADSTKTQAVSNEVESTNNSVNDDTPSVAVDETVVEDSSTSSTEISGSDVNTDENSNNSSLDSTENLGNTSTETTENSGSISTETTENSNHIPTETIENSSSDPTVDPSNNEVADIAA